jgi:hypothetical protein
MSSAFKTVRWNGFCGLNAAALDALTNNAGYFVIDCRKPYILVRCTSSQAGETVKEFAFSMNLKNNHEEHRGREVLMC